MRKKKVSCNINTTAHVLKRFMETPRTFNRTTRRRLTCIHDPAQLDPAQVTATQKNPPPTPGRQQSAKRRIKPLYGDNQQSVGIKSTIKTV